jgi:hypothetical protein
LTDNGRRDVGDVLRMVSEGKISPEEGEKLLDALERKQTSRRCPWCAETIPATALRCPECHSDLARASGEARPGRGYRTLGGLSKGLIVYVFVVCGIVLLGRLGHFTPVGIPQMLLAGLGILAAVLMCKGERAGWGLGVAWSCAQIVEIIVSGTALNRQFLHVGVTFTANGAGFGINLVGIVLLVLFLKAGREWGRRS